MLIALGHIFECTRDLLGTAHVEWYVALQALHLEHGLEVVFALINCLRLLGSAWLLGANLELLRSSHGCVGCCLVCRLLLLLLLNVSERASVLICVVIGG